MRRKKKKRSSKNNIGENKSSYLDYFYHQPGISPGTLQIQGGSDVSRIILIDYNIKDVAEVELKSPEECTSYIHKNSVSWIDVQGLGNEEILRKTGEIFSLHPLLLEDVVNVPQRAKVEEYEEHVLIILHMLRMTEEEKPDFGTEQVSFVLGKKYLLTFQEEPLYDTFEKVRERLKLSKGNIRKKNADYLAYALIDSIIDGFYPVLETYGEEIENLEEEVMENPTRKTLKKMYYLKRKLLELRRLIWPVRDSINILIRDEDTLIGKDVKVYLRDCYDHAVQILDMVENYRDLTYGLMDVYMSSVGNKMNDIMKVLTIIATIFIPLTFIAGVYGMNFNTEISPLNMPELNWYLGYPLCWILMILIASSLAYFFWIKGWFQSFSGTKDEEK